MVALTFIGCKPTEKNYKSAYDAALEKRAEAVREQMIPATGMMSVDGPQMKVVAGDTIFIQRDRFRDFENKNMPAPWAVAVGVYSMDTNAKASLKSLSEAGWDMETTVVKAPGTKNYAVVAFAPTLDECIAISKKFQEKFPDYHYIGLPGAPVLLAR